MGLAGELEQIQARVRAAGDAMLENLEVSYVYGGSRVGDAKTCDECNQCLEIKQPAPQKRFSLCPICSGCSLDCSHFIQLVFAQAGLSFAYLTSTQMLVLSADLLERRHQLRPVVMPPLALDGDVMAADLLVYRGHVVIVETVHGNGQVDIIHATGGRDIREPGQGIQRERFVVMDRFRGPLLRVLRHVKLDQLRRQRVAVSSSEAYNRIPETGRLKLRPVEKRRVD
jgi:hypothetical protein